MAADNQIKITNLPKASEVKSGDYIILETDTGTVILDYKDFIIGSDNITFWPTLSGNTTNIKSLSTTQVSLSSEIASFRTTVSTVSGLSGITWRDSWNSSTTYKRPDAVAYNNSSFIAIATSTNQAPVNASGVLNSNYWQYLAKAGVGTLTNTGGLLVGAGDGTSNQLTPGDSGYVLKSQGSGNQLVWANQDTGRQGAVCDRLPLFNQTTSSIEWNFHYLMTDNSVQGTGETYGLGAGYNESYDNQRALPHPVTMPGDYDYQSAEHKIRDIYPGGYHTFLLTVSGHVYGAGYNGTGTLGIGSTTTQYTFKKIDFPAGVRIRHIVISYDNGISGYTAYFITRNDGEAPNDGRVYATGNNGTGQIGDGTTVNRTTPTRCGTLTGVDKLWAWGGGNGTVFALLDDGNFYGWGDAANNGYRLGNGSTTNLLTPTKQSGSGFTPNDHETTGLHGVKDVRVHYGYNGSTAYYSSTFALLTSGHIYVCGYNDGSYQLGLPDTTNRTKWTCVSGVSAAYEFDTHASYTTSSCIATCSAIIGGEWNQSTNKYENFTDHTATSGVMLVGFGNNTSGRFGNNSTTTSIGPRIMNDWLPTALCTSVSSVICEVHSRGNYGAWTYIRDLSGYYWFAGNNSYGLDTQNQAGETALSNQLEFVKISLPCHPADIKDFRTYVVDLNDNNNRQASMILTYDGKVFANGALFYTFGVGWSESGTSDHARSSWHNVKF